MRKKGFLQKTALTVMITAVFSGSALFPGSVLAGNPGWQNEDGVWHYYQGDGSHLVSAITPDGYLVDENGVWEQKNYSILGVSVDSPDRFCTASQMGDWSSLLEQLNAVNRQIQLVLEEKRVFHVYGDSIEYCRKSGDTETLLLGLYKDTDTNGYRLNLSVDLGNRNMDLSKASTYDYQVFLFLCAKISSSPAVVADAIYSSWQEQNAYGLQRLIPVSVADADISYDVAEGVGIYYLTARQPS